MTDRIERHREMATRTLQVYQGLSKAHAEGREPILAPPPPGPKVIFYTPQQGEREVDASPYEDPGPALRELKMYWRRIPDFGVERFEVYPSETGWAQAMYWRGTGENGKTYTAEEADIVVTDEDCNIVRLEAYSDTHQWSKIVAYCNDMTLKELRAVPSFDALMDES
jgi:hypothetical protein